MWQQFICEMGGGYRTEQHGLRWKAKDKTTDTDYRLQAVLKTYETLMDLLARQIMDGGP